MKRTNIHMWNTRCEVQSVLFSRGMAASGHAEGARGWLSRGLLLADEGGSPFSLFLFVSFFIVFPFLSFLFLFLFSVFFFVSCFSHFCPLFSPFFSPFVSLCFSSCFLLFPLFSPFFSLSSFSPLFFLVSPFFPTFFHLFSPCVSLCSSFFTPIATFSTLFLPLLFPLFSQCFSSLFPFFTIFPFFQFFSMFFFLFSFFAGGQTVVHDKQPQPDTTTTIPRATTQARAGALMFPSSCLDGSITRVGPGLCPQYISPWYAREAVSCSLNSSQPMLS